MESKVERRKVRKNKHHHTPDQGWGWVVVAATAFNNGMIIGFDICYPLIFVALMDKLQASPEQLFWIVALYRGIRSFVSPAASALCNRFGHRKVVILGGAMNAAALILFAFPISVFYQCFSWGFLGACACSMIQVGSVAMNGLYFLKLRARAMSFAACGISIGAITLPLLVNYLLITYGYTGAILLVAAVMMHICPFSFVFRPISSLPTFQFTDAEHPSLPDEAGSHQVQGKVFRDELKDQENDDTNQIINLQRITYQQPSDRKFISPSSNNVHNEKITKRCDGFLKSLNSMFRFTVLKDMKVLLFCIVLTAFSVAFTVTNSFLSAYAKEISLDASIVAIALAIASAVSLTCRIITGFLYDLQCLKRKLSLVAFFHCAICGVTTLMIPLLAKDMISLYIYWCLCIASIGPFLGVYPAVLLALVGPEKFTSSLGICRLFESVGYIVGPTISGALYEKTGTYASPYYFAGVLLLVCTGLAIAYTIWDARNHNGDGEDENQRSNTEAT